MSRRLSQAEQEAKLKAVYYIPFYKNHVDIRIHHCKSSTHRCSNQLMERIYTDFGAFDKAVG